MRYLGTNPQLRREIDIHQPALDRIYLSIFGPLYQRIEQIEHELLVPGAFLESLGELPSWLGPGGTNSAVKTDTHFVPIVGLPEAVRIQEDGTICSKPRQVIETTCAIVMDPAGIEYKRSIHHDKHPPALTAYAHEYHHFLTYGLQERPMIAALVLPTRALQLRGHIFEPEKLAETGAAIFGSGPGPDAEYQKNVAGLWFGLSSFFEDLANTLEARVMRRLGYDASDFEEWASEGERGKLATFQKLHALSDERLVSVLTDWEAYAAGNDFCRSFVRSLRNIRFKKLDIERYVERNRPSRGPDTADREQGSDQRNLDKSGI